MMRRICYNCGREFFPIKGPGQKYCSTECKKELTRIRRREYRKNRIARGRGESKRITTGDKCSECGYDVHYALEYSHERHDLLCANCHRSFHPGGSGRLSNATGIRFPVKIAGALYDPGFPYEPERCYLCECRIDPSFWEKHHMIGREYGGDRIGNENIVIICANCHKILTRATEIDDIFKYFLNSERNPLPSYSSIEKYTRLSLVYQIKIMKEFYEFLRERWNIIVENMVKKERDNF